MEEPGASYEEHQNYHLRNSARRMITADAKSVRYGVTRPSQTTFGKSHSADYKTHQCCSNNGSSGPAIGPLLFSYHGPSQKRFQEMLKKRQRRKQLKQQSKVQRSISLWSDRASAYVEEIFKKRASQSTSGQSFPRPQRSSIKSTADLKIPETAHCSVILERRSRNVTLQQNINSKDVTPEAQHVALRSVKTRRNESRKIHTRSGRLAEEKLTNSKKVGDIGPEVSPRTMIYLNRESEDNRHDKGKGHQPQQQGSKHKHQEHGTPIGRTSSIELIGLEGLVMRAF